MSTPNNLFEQIIIPIDAPSAWPPAPIYWLILSIIILAVASLTWFIRRYKKQQQVVKQTLAVLTLLQQQGASFIQLNQLLKGLCLQYYAREQVASLAGDEWFAFLQLHNGANLPLFTHEKIFCERLYKQHYECTPQDFSSAQRWIKEFPTHVKRLRNEQAGNQQKKGHRDV